MPYRASTHQGLDHLGRVGLGISPVEQLVARKLLGEKAVPRLVVLERADYVVAIAPHSLGKLNVARLEVLAGRVDVADGIEPVPVRASSTTFDGAGIPAVTCST